ncbi:MAG: hypothetical protein U9P38_05945 [Campylobacterota bacterium]|nr:hypothetical protein [Campylobacterota bacterium]
MKYFLVTLFLLGVQGCSYKNAYTSFDMNKTAEHIESNTQSSKIEFNERVEGLFTAIYLNNIYKNRFVDEEIFVISLYIKDEMADYKFKLNSENIIDSEKIESNHKYFSLISHQNSWNKNFMIKFKTSARDLNLTLENNNRSSLLKFQKE